MTRFADQLFDDLMRDHGSTLAHTRVPAAPKRHPAVRPVLLTAGAGGLAVAATVGSLVATGGGTPAYAVTRNPDGTVTLAVYQESGIAGANAQLRALGDDRVVVVPVESGCPSISSLPAPRVPARQITVRASGSGGSVTVAAQGVPAGDVLVLGIENSGNGRFQFSMEQSTKGSNASGSSSGSAGTTGSGPGSRAGQGGTATRLTSGPAPSCVSIPAPPARPAQGKSSSGPTGGQSSHQSSGSSTKSLSTIG
jgi:hypothetical protein